MPAEHETLEGVLNSLQRGTDKSLRAARAAVRGIQNIQAILAQGNIRNLGNSIESVRHSAAQLSGSVEELRERYDFDPREYLRSGRYAEELRAEADRAGLTMIEEDALILCHPSVVRLLPNEMAIQVDRAREHRLRPSTVVGVLAARQRQASRFNPETFLNSLRQAYELLAAKRGKRPDAVIRLVDIWHVLTLLPGQGREYTKQEFTRDLYLLDRDGVTSTRRSPRKLRWCASTGTRGAGLLKIITTEGQQRAYWGISFSQESLA